MAFPHNCIEAYRACIVVVSNVYRACIVGAKCVFDTLRYTLDTESLLRDRASILSTSEDRYEKLKLNRYAMVHRAHVDKISFQIYVALWLPFVIPISGIVRASNEEFLCYRLPHP